MSATPSFRHRLEALGLRLLLGGLGCLPVRCCSAFGGLLGRSIGPLLGINKKADQNLRLVMPELDRDARQRIIREMWENLGQVIFEYPHLREIADPAKDYITVEGMEHLQAMRDQGKALICVGAHMGNWEILPMTAALRGFPQTVIVRTPNNPQVAEVIDRIRESTGNKTAPKGAPGARASVKVIKEKGSLGLLADQKMNDGLEVPFFGQPAMTPTAPAQLALGGRAAIMPVQCKRLGPARFKLICHPPLELPDTGDRQADIREGMTRLNKLYEDWIREEPGSWLWLHRRWPKALYKSLKENQ